MNKKLVKRRAMTTLAMTALICSTNFCTAWAASGGLTSKQLSNSSWKADTIGEEPETIHFKNGKAKWGECQGEILNTAIGDLDGDGINDGACTWGYSSGGSGFFTYLTVFLSKSGQSVQIGSRTLGDRSNPEKLTIVNKVLILDITAHKESDPAGIPTLKRVAKFTVKNNKLVGPDDIH